MVGLNELSEWMRANGVIHARLGDMELRFERTPSPPVDPNREPARLKTAEEIAKDRHERRRSQLSSELGWTPTDEQMERLP